MNKYIYIITSLLLLFAIQTAPKSVYAQDDPIMIEVRRDEAHPVLRGFSELAFGTVLGTAVAGVPIISGVFFNPFKLEGPLIAAAFLNPAGVASGVILGGYLTQSYSNYWAPFVGAYAGAIVADITAFFLSDDYPIMSAILVIALPIVTSVIAAEASHAHEKHDAYYPFLLTIPF